MKKILGLDLGVASIGWAMVERPEAANATSNILGMGVRIVPLSSDETDEFTKGQPVTTNQARRMSRGMRRGYYRYRLRKASLKRELEQMGALPTAPQAARQNSGLSKGQPSNLESYGLRAKAVEGQVSLAELGRVLYHLNQKRGFKSNRKTDRDEGGKKLGDYLQEIKNNQVRIAAENLTIGQFFYARLLEDSQYRVKGQIFPRACYVEEFDRIWACQSEFYPEILTEARRKRLRDGVIFWQRKLKSQKGLVSKCAFEPSHRVCPKSSPLFQVSKIWEGLNNVSYFDRDGKKHSLTLEQKQKLFALLNEGGKLPWTKACKEIGLNPRDHTPDLKTKENGIEGNTIVAILKTAFTKAEIVRPDLLRFDLKVVERNDVNRADKATGEIRTVVDAAAEQEPLYRLWHAIYSIEEDVDLQRALVNNFELSEAQAAVLSRLDFTRQGYGSKSAKVIRRLLPYLQQGLVYSDACLIAGYNHSNSMTLEERGARPLDDLLAVIPKNELRSPIVEKIMNQLIHLVNAILVDPRYGRPDEIRIEYGRELQQNAEKRESTFKSNNERDREAKEIAERLIEHGVKVTRKSIEKYRLYMSVDGLSPYSGERLELGKYLRGENADIDHIVPQSRLFDDSFANKTISEYAHNRAKGDKTAFEYMQSLGAAKFEQYRELIHQWYQDKKISAKKRDYFLMADEDIPDDFIDRDMRLTSFIAKEAGTRLLKICNVINATSGKVTAYLRHCWGWDDVLKKLNLQQYKDAGLTYETTLANGMIETRIWEGYWSKRDDHRHHAIDALVVACTRQDFIQKLNTLNAQHGGTSKKAVEEFFADQKPFTTRQVMAQVAGILVSFNSRKRVVSRSKNVIEGHEQTTLAPRGALSEGTVYGKIQVADRNPVKISTGLSLEDARAIVPKNIRRLVLDRLLEYGNDPAKAFKGYKNNPIYLDETQTQPLMVVELPFFREEFVVKYKLDANFKAKDAAFIVDKHVREVVLARLAAHGGKEREAFRDLDQFPIWLNEAKRVQVRTVRCFTGLSKVVAVSKNADGKGIGFVKPGNNHHIAIYQDRDGNLHENAVTFWDAVIRRRLDLPAVIKHPSSVWDHLTEKVLPGIGTETFAELEAQLPRADWEYVMSMNINEMFVFGMEARDLDVAIAAGDYEAIGPQLYRVQKVSNKDYVFRRHVETRVDDKFGEDKNPGLAVTLGRMIRYKSIPPLMLGIKVTINRLGQIERAKP
jgi:CRISPR-associated endonuclease Csn1